MTVGLATADFTQPWRATATSLALLCLVITLVLLWVAYRMHGSARQLYRQNVGKCTCVTRNGRRPSTMPMKNNVVSKAAECCQCDEVEVIALSKGGKSGTRARIARIATTCPTFPRKWPFFGNIARKRPDRSAAWSPNGHRGAMENGKLQLVMEAQNMNPIPFCPGRATRQPAFPWPEPTRAHGLARGRYRHWRGAQCS
jgi:hypothetical protein